MTGWRIGYAASAREVIDAINSQDIACANTTAQIVSIEALNGRQRSIAQHNAIFMERRNIAVEHLNTLPSLSCHKPQSAFLRVSHLCRNNWQNELQAAN